MLYEYKALKNNKRVVKKLESQSEDSVLAYLRTNGYTPIDIYPAKKFSFADMLSKVKGVKFSDIVDFTRQLAIMLNAGLTVVESLDILKKQVQNKALKALVDDIDDKIKSGDSLSSALRSYPQYFSNLYIALVRSGEASGKLGDIMIRLAENLEKTREFRGRLKNALIYPAVIIAAMLIVMFVMITFVVPKLLDLYKDFDVELPLTTKILVAVSDFSAKFWPLIIIAVVGIVMGVMSYLRTRPGRLMKDTLLLRAPVFSSVIKMSALVDATRTLAVLIGSGVSILDTLNIVVETTGNLIYQQAFKTVYMKVEKGESLGKALAEEKVFPPILIQMTIVGENTGNLDDTLARLAHYFETESDLAIKAITVLIEPAILIVLGVAVGGLVFAIITPIYSLTTALQ